MRYKQRIERSRTSVNDEALISLRPVFENGCLLYYKGERMELDPRAITNDFHGEGSKIRDEIKARLLPSSPQLKILDIGTGYGHNVSFLRSILPDDCAIWTLDPSKDVVERVEKMMRETGLASNVKFVNARAEEMPFEDNFFDVVVSVVLLHHLEKLEPALMEMLRVAKGKGNGKVVLVDYRPEAHVLNFASRHKREDFFEPERVAMGLEKLGALLSVKKFQYWYVIEASKPS